MIDPKKLAEWRALCEKATEGPWDWWRAEWAWEVTTADGKRTDIGDFNDAAFIAAAREAVPALLDEVEKLRSEVVALDKQWCGASNYAMALNLKLDELQVELDKERLDHLSTLGQVQEAYDRGFHAGWTEEREACIRWVEETKALTFSERSVLQAAVARIRARGGDGE